MVNRRTFSKTLASIFGSSFFFACNNPESTNSIEKEKIQNGPLIISTWNNEVANNIAIEELKKNSSDLITAIERGINSVEADPEDTSVGYGGMPDREGNVTLDACVMDKTGNAGSVTYLQKIKHPVSVARKVMEDTPHVILSGKGAQDFAVASGHKLENLLTENASEALKEWLKTSEYSPQINIERHDTIGMIGKTSDGDLGGACSTSGLSFKLPGRVGDSPIIGSGLFVDNEIGSAVATGLGELVLKTCSTFLVVELMRMGASPQKACETAIKRIIKNSQTKDAQVGLVAMNKKGEFGGFSIHKGFSFVVSTKKETKLIEAKSYNN